MTAPGEFCQRGGAIAEQERRLDRLEAALFGNSREGLVQTSVRTEERVADLESRVEGAEAASGGLMAKVHTMATSIALLGYAIWDSRMRGL